MYRILSKEYLTPTVVRISVDAPLVARAARAGQFIILRVSEDGERIPLTVADCDREVGSVSVIYQVVGATTLELSHLEVGDALCDFVGPLGMPTELSGVSSALVVGGGVGCAIALPVAKALSERGASVTSVIGFRSRDMVILEEEFSAISKHLTVTTDDGSYGRAGNVTLPVKELLLSGARFDRVFVIGPLVMMKYVVEAVRPYGIPVTVSMNPVMIDGTGMCGGCRLSLVKDGVRTVRFACVDGPDFDGYEVDFDEAMMRLSAYRTEERRAHDAACNLFLGEA
jgi:ferredoxin--NADP+ reductase